MTEHTPSSSPPEGFDSLADVFAVCAAGYEQRESLIEHLVGILVDIWHGNGPSPDGSLSEFLGLTEEQYAAYVEQRYADV